MKLWSRGCLLLKQEPNGLHLRWIVLDQKSQYIYWLNPKKEVLVIDRESMIPLSQIHAVVISPDVQVIFLLSFFMNIFFEKSILFRSSPSLFEFLPFRKLRGSTKSLPCPLSPFPLFSLELGSRYSFILLFARLFFFSLLFDFPPSFQRV
jgi:hypothetical protein